MKELQKHTVIQNTVYLLLFTEPQANIYILYIYVCVCIYIICVCVNRRKRTRVRIAGLLNEVPPLLHNASAGLYKKPRHRKLTVKHPQVLVHHIQLDNAKTDFAWNLRQWNLVISSSQQEIKKIQTIVHNCQTYFSVTKQTNK